MTYPNILFILADDLGCWSLGYTGNQDAITPHLDGMARQGMVIQNFFCASPVCSPARATLLTGRMPSVHGVLDWLDGGNMSTAGAFPVEYLREFRGYTDYLHEVGYQCALSGKWHLGDSMRPQKGFGHWYAHQYGGGSYQDAPMIRDGIPVHEPGYITHAITRDAVEFLHRRDPARPFYLSVHYTAPHTPWLQGHPRRYLELYRDCTFDSCPMLPRHPWQIDFEEFDQDRLAMLRGYFAATTAMDEGVGQLLDTLDEEGLAGNTLVVFTSDNGFNCGHHGIWGKGNGTNPINMYESSIKVPFLARMPGTVPAGTQLQGLYSAYDVFPTLLDFAGVSHTETHLPGHSFAQLLRGAPEPPSEGEDGPGVVVYDEYGAVRALRGTRWKYIRRWPTGPDELYDLLDDPDECQNLVDKADRTLVHCLQKRLDNWFAGNCRPQTDGRFAGVTGAGQLKVHTAVGFEPSSFNPQYSALR